MQSDLTFDILQFSNLQPESNVQLQSSLADANHAINGKGQWILDWQDIVSRITMSPPSDENEHAYGVNCNDNEQCYDSVRVD